MRFFDTVAQKFRDFFFSPSGINTRKRPKYVTNRPLIASEMQDEINLVVVEGLRSSECDQDFSDDDSIVDETFVAESNSSYEDTKSEDSASEDEHFDLEDKKQIDPNASSIPNIK